MAVVLLREGRLPHPRHQLLELELERRLPRCTLWHASIITRIKKLDPDLIVLSSSDYLQHDGNDLLMTNKEWEAGMEKWLPAHGHAQRRGGHPREHPLPDPECADLPGGEPHQRPVLSSPKRIAAPASAAVADIAAAEARHVLYVDVLPWICSATCSPIIGSVLVSEDRFHITQTYAEYLTGVLATPWPPS